MCGIDPVCSSSVVFRCWSHFCSFEAVSFLFFTLFQPLKKPWEFLAPGHYHWPGVGSIPFARTLPSSMALMFWGDFCLFQPLKSPKSSWLLEEFVLGGHWDRPGAGLIPSARTKRTPPPSFSRHLSPVEQQPWGGLWPKDLISPSSRYLILSYLLPQNRSRGSY